MIFRALITLFLLSVLVLGQPYIYPAGSFAPSMPTLQAIPPGPQFPMTMPFVTYFQDTATSPIPPAAIFLFDWQSDEQGAVGGIPDPASYSEVWVWLFPLMNPPTPLVTPWGPWNASLDPILEFQIIQQYWTQGPGVTNAQAWIGPMTAADYTMIPPLQALYVGFASGWPAFAWTSGVAGDV